MAAIPVTQSDDRSLLAARKVAFAYDERVILRDASFDIYEGEFVCLLGPSGCGKTTLLNLIAGFLMPTAGDLLFQGERITGPGPERAVVVQAGALFNWMSVADNVVFSLICRGAPKKERTKVGDRMIKLVGLQGFEHRYPYELSGGMRQRVGVARVLAASPRIMLMDEPFAAVDVQTRETLQEEVLRIHAETKCTTVFVTHSIEEAVFLADRIFVLSEPSRAGWDTVQVDLPSPRWQPENRLHPHFMAARERIYREMRKELRHGTSN